MWRYPAFWHVQPEPAPGEPGGDGLDNPALLVVQLGPGDHGAGAARAASDLPTAPSSNVDLQLSHRH